VNSLSSRTLTLSKNENVLEVKNDKNSAEFSTIDAGEFPPLPETTDKPLFSIDAKKFAHAINQTAIASATYDSRPVLTGLLFELSETKLNIVGVDGFRLSKKTLTIENSGKVAMKQVVPAKALLELSRMCMDTEDDEKVNVFLLSEKNQMLFTFDDISVSSRLIEGEFPDYEQIIPKESKFKFCVDKDALAKTVKVVNIFARSSVGSKAVFSFLPEKNSLNLSAQVADIGENESSVDVHDVAGENMKTAFNTKFLSDMVNVIEGEEISFESNGVTAPGVFLDKKDKDFLHIIMPMRIE